MREIWENEGRKKKDREKGRGRKEETDINCFW